MNCIENSQAHPFISEDFIFLKMEENLITSEEYVFVDSISPVSSETNLVRADDVVYKTQDRKSDPPLKIANNGNKQDLEKELNEVIKDVETESLSQQDAKENTFDDDGGNIVDFPNVDSGNYTIFNQIIYLGAASINNPCSEPQILRNMAILNSQRQEQHIDVSVSIPSDSKGNVIIYDATSKVEMVRFKIHRIIYCARGAASTPDASCFAFTSSHGDSEQTAILQCHIFRCQIPEAIERVLSTFVSAFNRRSYAHQMLPEECNSEACEYQFDISLEIKEEDNKGNYNTIPRDKDIFKLRSNIEKQLIFTVTPVSNSDLMGASNDLFIERCFGILVAHGRKVKHADLNLLEMNTVGSINGDKRYITTGHWDPKDAAFAVLNEETPKDVRIYMTVAIDLVIRGIQEPVRFVIEPKVRIYPQNERFWYFSKKSLTHLFSLKLKQSESSPQGDHQFVVVSVDNLGEVERLRPSTMSLSLNLSSLTSSTFSSLSTRSPSIASIETPYGDEDTDDDEPLLSGSGEVSKECPESVLESWKEILPKWQAAPVGQVTKSVAALVKKGVPEALRGEVWQLLAGCSTSSDMMETYRILITKECHCEQVILRDINRTFPAHEYFKHSGGVGQESLYKISRAYSVYDEEVSYCQGTSFLAAALLLHMPEEQAFCILVKIMFDYGLRLLFKDNFEVLHLRFYQLDRLMEEQLPDLWSHFQCQGIESHMFASQWFLTLYTAKFPLFMVFHYLDIFLLNGMDSVFQVAIALLQISRKELLTYDFEGILKYFRVTLPKKFRNEEHARQMIRIAISTKVKKIKKYEREYVGIKEQETLREDPTIRLERENQKLLDEKMRLDRENDYLSTELVTSKIEMMKQIDKLEHRCETLTNDEMRNSMCLQETEEEKKRLQEESSQVKELLKREVVKAESQTKSNSAIITDYKKICSQLSDKLDKEQKTNQKLMNDYKEKMASCESCSKILFSLNNSAPPSKLAKEESNDLQKQIKELEMELAKTKLALVESECKNQDLTHQLNQAIFEIQTSKNNWLQKTLTSISSLKDRTGSGGPVSRQTSVSTSPPLSPRQLPQPYFEQQT